MLTLTRTISCVWWDLIPVCRHAVKINGVKRTKLLAVIFRQRISRVSNNELKWTSEKRLKTPLVLWAHVWDTETGTKREDDHPLSWRDTSSFNKLVGYLMIDSGDQGGSDKHSSCLLWSALWKLPSLSSLLLFLFLWLDQHIITAAGRLSSLTPTVSHRTPGTGASCDKN